MRTGSAVFFIGFRQRAITQLIRMAIRTLEEWASDFKASLDVNRRRSGAKLREQSLSLLSKGGVVALLSGGCGSAFR